MFELGQREAPTGNHGDRCQDGIFHVEDMLICNEGCAQSPTKLDQPLWTQESFR
jgi:hypothetical protein